MNKKIIQDILSIPSIARHPKVRDFDEEERFGERRSPKKKAWASLLFIVIGAIVILGAFFFLSSTFSKVTVKVTTTTKDIDVGSLVFLNKDGMGGGLKYEIMRFIKTESINIPTIGAKVVQRTATGEVTIYNSFSTAAQKLVVGTRLETKDGKIYKIDKAVSIPGTTSVSGKIVPGSVKVTVKANQTGPSYNIPPSDFTIPGLKGSAKYTKIVARSNTNISGGFSGTVKIAAAFDIQKARVKIEESLKQKLTKDAVAQVPEGMILYNDAMILSFTDNTVGDSTLPSVNGVEVNLQVTGSLNALIINREDLKKLIIGNKLPELNAGENIVMPNLDQITFTIVNKDKVSLNGAGSILVKLSGTLPVAWDFDEEALRKRLSGLRKTNYHDVLKTFPMIEKVEATFSPSWALYFPGDLDRIVINKGLK